MKFENAHIIGDRITYEQYSVQPIDQQTQKPVGRGHKDYIMSRGELVEFLACPQKWLVKEKTSDSTKSLDYGSLIDCLALTPDKFDDLFCVCPETYQNDRGEEKPWHMGAKFCKDWVDKRSDKTMVTREAFDKAESAINALCRDERILEFFRCSRRQVYVIGEYVDPTTKIRVKVRALTDLLPDPKHPLYGKSIGDFKTAQNASPQGWAYPVDDHAYDVQGALNLDLHTSATPDVERIEFRHLIQESSAPFQTGRRILSEEFIQKGRATYLAALRIYCRALSTGVWPDYEIGNLVLGGWSLTQPTPYMVKRVLDLEEAFVAPVEKTETQERMAS